MKPFALLYSAGIRPDNLVRMAGRKKELANLKTRTIPANVSRTRHERNVAVSENNHVAAPCSLPCRKPTPPFI